MFLTMSVLIKRLIPYLIIILGIFLLLFMGQAIAAGVCVLVGVVMIIEKIWPEQWDADIDN